MIDYLSTLGFSGDWLDEITAAVPDARVRQISAQSVSDVPAEVWSQVQALHTGGVIPDRALAPRLRWVQLDTAGIDHLAGHPIWSDPVQVTTIGGVSPVPMAEYVLMMVLASAHHLPALLTAQRDHDWPTPDERWRRFLPAPVAGTTMVIVGFGRIGRRIGELAAAFGMSVIGVSRSGEGRATSDGPDATSDTAGHLIRPTGRFDAQRPAPAVELVAVDALPEVAARADHLVVVTPLTDATRGLIDAHVLARLPPSATLLDVGRGGVVDEDALLAALDSDRLRGAVLDVFAEEPLPVSHPLWDHPRVIVTPHVSGFAPAYERDVLELVIDNLGRLRDGRPLRNLVDGVRGY